MYLIFVGLRWAWARAQLMFGSSAYKRCETEVMLTFDEGPIERFWTHTFLEFIFNLACLICIWFLLNFDELELNSCLAWAPTSRAKLRFCWNLMRAPNWEGLDNTFSEFILECNWLFKLLFVAEKINFKEVIISGIYLYIFLFFENNVLLIFFISIIF